MLGYEILRMKDLVKMQGKHVNKIDISYNRLSNYVKDLVDLV